MNTYDVWAGWGEESRGSDANKWTVDTHGPHAECVVTTMITKSIGKRGARRFVSPAFTPMNPSEALFLAAMIDGSKKGRTIVSIVYNGQEVLRWIDLPAAPPEPVVGVAGVSCAA